jgi:uncharacterized protein
MQPAPTHAQSFFTRYPIASYFILTFAISWLGALAVAFPHLLHRESLPKLTAILMFPAMLLGPSVAGILLTRFVDGANGWRALFSRMFSLDSSKRWFLVLLLPPILVLAVLLFLSACVSPVYTPNLFFIGILFGVPAGLLEEIGWTGFAFPKMCVNTKPLLASIALGLLWSLWHLPVIDFLGVASPHGAYLLPFFLAFALAMTAVRVLISWLYANTRSVLLAQLLHITFTGSLVIFGPPRVTATQEALWYALYGALLWLTVLLVVHRSGKPLLANDRGF